MIDPNFWNNIALGINANITNDYAQRTQNTNNLMNGIGNALGGFFERKKAEDERKRIEEQLEQKRNAASGFLGGKNIDGYTFTDSEKALIMNSDNPEQTAIALYNDAQGRADTKKAKDEADALNKRSEQKSVLEGQMNQLSTIINSGMVSSGQMMTSDQKEALNDARKKYNDYARIYVMTYGPDALNDYLIQNPIGQETPQNMPSGNVQSVSNPIVMDDKSPIVEAPKDVEPPQNEIVKDYTNADSLWVPNGEYDVDSMADILENAPLEVIEDIRKRLEKSPTNNWSSVWNDQRIQAMLKSRLKDEKMTASDLIQKYPRLTDGVDFETDFGRVQGEVKKQKKTRQAEIIEQQNFVDQQKKRKKDQEQEKKDDEKTEKENATKLATEKLNQMFASTEKISRYNPPEGIDKEIWMNVCKSQSDKIISHNRYLK